MIEKPLLEFEINSYFRTLNIMNYLGKSTLCKFFSKKPKWKYKQTDWNEELYLKISKLNNIKYIEANSLVCGFILDNIEKSRGISYTINEEVPDNKINVFDNNNEYIGFICLKLFNYNRANRFGRVDSMFVQNDFKLENFIKLTKKLGF
jgi:hypothetical protein